MSFQSLQHGLRKLLRKAAAALLLATMLPALHAMPVYDNLAASQDGSDAVYPGPLANAFTTGASGGMLGGVQALLMSLGNDPVAKIFVNLLADNGTQPGTLLASLGSMSSADIATAGFAVYDFTPLTAFVLAPDTTYWVQILTDSANAVQWSWSMDTSALGVDGEHSFNPLFGVMSNNQAGAYQMAVAIPEPGSASLVGLGLGLAVATALRRRRPAR